MKRLLLFLLTLSAVATQAATLTVQFFNTNPPGTNWVFYLAWTNAQAGAVKMPSISPVIGLQNAETMFPTNGGTLMYCTISNTAYAGPAAESAPSILLSPPLPSLGIPTPVAPGVTVTAMAATGLTATNKLIRQGIIRQPLGAEKP